MFKGIIKTKETRLVFVGNGSVFRDPLFLDADKTPVHSGDTVEFYPKPDTVYPSSGRVSNHSGLRIECFNNILNKWQYYKLEI